MCSKKNDETIKINKDDKLSDDISSNEQHGIISCYKKLCLVAKKYICEVCDYTTSKKSSYTSHLSCKKHLKNYANINKKLKNVYICNICDYNTSSKYNYQKHQKTKTHNKIVNENKNENANDYMIKNNLYSSIMDEIKHLMVEQSKFSQEQAKFNQEQTKMNQAISEIANKSSNMTNINNNKQNNQQFNMNVFLNETCKDAMNMSDFIENLHVSMEDMEKTGELGFAKGMSRIIMNNLNAIEVCKRPIHCSDAKRETLYVKNNGVWEKETQERTKIKEVIYKVSCLNERQLIKWRDLPRNKGYHLSDHHKNDEFMNLVMEINKMRDDEIDKVITTISKHVAIDKVKMSGYLN
jgi:hypothetical protein